MEKKKEKTMMMTLCLSDLEEWKKALRQKTRTKSRQNKRKKRNSINALEAAVSSTKSVSAKNVVSLGTNPLAKHTIAIAIATTCAHGGEHAKRFLGASLAHCFTGSSGGMCQQREPRFRPATCPVTSLLPATIGNR